MEADFAPPTPEEALLYFVQHLVIWLSVPWTVGGLAGWNLAKQLARTSKGYKAAAILLGPFFLWGIILVSPNPEAQAQRKKAWASAKALVAALLMMAVILAIPVLFALAVPNDGGNDLNYDRYELFSGVARIARGLAGVMGLLFQIAFFMFVIPLVIITTPFLAIYLEKLVQRNSAASADELDSEKVAIETAKLSQNTEVDI